jgi:porin
MTAFRQIAAISRASLTAALLAVLLTADTQMLLAECNECAAISHGETCCHSCGDSLWERDELLGDLWGVRPALGNHGIAVESSLTQFYQGVASGGTEQRFRYGGKFDLYFDINTEKAGLWKGGNLDIHAADGNFGQNSILDAAGLAPVNSAMILPLPEPSFALTHMVYTQELGKGWLTAAGRFNGLDLWQMFYPEYGRALDGFMQTSLIAPLSIVPSLPVVFNAGGLIHAGEKGLEYGVIAIDTQNIQTVSGLNDMFNNGVSILGFYRLFTEFGGKYGSHTFVGNYATGDFTRYDSVGWLPQDPLTDLAGAVGATEKEGAWTGIYIGEQNLWEHPCNKKRKIYSYWYAGFADPENSIFESNVGGYVEAFGTFASRDNDRAGIGYFYSGVSKFLKQDLAALGLRDLQGGEVYYNAEITPWFHLTADVQVLQPEFDRQDTALVLGLRGKLDF